jgi:hypothetical protein
MEETRRPATGSVRNVIDESASYAMLPEVGLNKQRIQLRTPIRPLDDSGKAHDGAVALCDEDAAVRNLLDRQLDRARVREEGVAYECSCPIGQRLQFCKHTVAIALAYLEKERAEAEQGLALLRQALTAIPTPSLVEGLLVLARRDVEWSTELKRMCLERLGSL